ncbi:MAG: phytoene desaturase [Pseudomonadota bacterium]
MNAPLSQNAKLNLTPPISGKKGIDPVLAETYEGRTACVIGAGFGGMALAIRLQSAGIKTTVVEARDKPGGRAYFWENEGFTFDAGPTVITDPPCLKELWELTGHDIAEDVELMKVMPFYRLNWPDGTNFDYSNDEEQLNAEIAKLNPDDVVGYQRFLQYSAEVHEEGYVKLGHKPFLDFKSMLKAAPALVKKQAWRSVYSMVSSFIESEKLREALSFHTLLVGGSPMKTSSIYALIHKLEKDGGVWWARGGTNRLIAGMVRHFERLGGTMRVGDGVKQVHTIGTRATEVETESGWKERFDAVASNADIMHSYKDLLSGSPRGPKYAKSLSRKSFSPSLFVVHFGLEGTWPGIPHHMILFGPRYKGLVEDIYKNGVLPQDFSIYLHHPTVSDPSMAPAGKSTFYALVPVAHMGKMPIDWDVEGPKLEKAILDEVGRRLIPDIHDRIVTKFSYAPKDFATDLNAHLGSAFSLEPVLWQSAYMRGHNRDDVIENFYLVGAGTHPGAGIPGVVGSAKATAGLVLEDLAAMKTA